MKKFLMIIGCACIVAHIFAVGSTDGGNGAASDKIQIRFLAMAQAAYSEQNVNDMTTDFMKKHPNIVVQTEFVPYEELRNKTMLAYGSNNPYDAVLVDDIWYAEYAQKGIISDITAQVPESYKKGVLSGGWNFTTKKGKIVGLPWFLDCMYLFYNKNMLTRAGYTKGPATIEEMVEMAKAIKAKGICEYPFAFSLAQAEALICVYSNFLEAYGAEYQDKNGNWIVDKTGVKALELLVQLKKDKLLNPNSTEYLEEDVRRVFSSGDCAFTMNWLYMYALASDPAESKLTKAQVGISVLPGIKGGKKYAAMSGSMGLSVVSKTKHPKEALEYILYLCSKEVQDKYSNLQLPVWTASYDDPAIIAGKEELAATAKIAFNIMNARPSVASYQEASAVLQQYIQKALYGELSPQEALRKAVAEMSRM